MPGMVSVGFFVPQTAPWIVSPGTTTFTSLIGTAKVPGTLLGDSTGNAAPSYTRKELKTGSVMPM